MDEPHNEGDWLQVVALWQGRLKGFMKKKWKRKV
jgi:hypothetical protein